MQFQCHERPGSSLDIPVFPELSLLRGHRDLAFLSDRSDKQHVWRIAIHLEIVCHPLPQDARGEGAEPLPELTQPVNDFARVIDDSSSAVLDQMVRSLKDASGDVVVIAGKGHEDYQIIGTTKHHFDDREEVRAYLSARYGEERA